MTQQLVSIIVPVFNRAHTLSRLFASLLAQQHRPLEIILVDNNSTDASLSVCQEFAQANASEEFAVHVVQESTPGAAAARNCGLHRASGEWVSFFDSDDEMSPDFISSMLAALCKCPTADFAVARTRMVFEDGTEQVRSGLEDLSLPSHILSAALSTQSFLARTAFMKRIGGWNAAVLFWDDYELGIRMLLHCHSFATLDRTFHRIYQHADSITGSSLGASFPKLQGAIPLIEREILSPGTSNSPHPSALIAYYFRLCILAGKLQAELCTEGAEWINQRTQQLSQQQPIPKQFKFIGYFFRLYTAHKGRGAWKIASYITSRV